MPSSQFLASFSLRTLPSLFAVTDYLSRYGSVKDKLKTATLDECQDLFFILLYAYGVHDNLGEKMKIFKDIAFISEYVIAKLAMRKGVATAKTNQLLCIANSVEGIVAVFDRGLDQEFKPAAKSAIDSKLRVAKNCLKNKGTHAFVEFLGALVVILSSKSKKTINTSSLSDAFFLLKALSLDTSTYADIETTQFHANLWVLSKLKDQAIAFCKANLPDFSFASSEDEEDEPCPEVKAEDVVAPEPDNTFSPPRKLSPRSPKEQSQDEALEVLKNSKRKAEEEAIILDSSPEREPHPVPIDLSSPKKLRFDEHLHKLLEENDRQTGKYLSPQVKTNSNGSSINVPLPETVSRFQPVCEPGSGAVGSLPYQLSDFDLLLGNLQQFRQRFASAIQNQPKFEDPSIKLKETASKHVIQLQQLREEKKAAEAETEKAKSQKINLERQLQKLGKERDEAVASRQSESVRFAEELRDCTNALKTSDTTVKALRAAFERR